MQQPNLPCLRHVYSHLQLVHALRSVMATCAACHVNSLQGAPPDSAPTRWVTCWAGWIPGNGHGNHKFQCRGSP